MGCGWHGREFCKTQYASVGAHVVIAELLIRARQAAQELGGTFEIDDEGDYVEPTEEQKAKNRVYLVRKIDEYRHTGNAGALHLYEEALVEHDNRVYRRPENVAKAFGDNAAVIAAVMGQLKTLGYKEAQIHGPGPEQHRPEKSYSPG